MSLSYLQSKVEQTQREVSNLQVKLSTATKKEADAAEKLARLQISMSGRLSPSQHQSKLRDFARIQGEAARAQKEQSNLNKQISAKTRDLHRYKSDLAKEEDRVRKKLIESDQKRQQEMTAYKSTSGQQLVTHRSLARWVSSSSDAVGEPAKKFDLFISHASEDKEEFVRPLAEALQSLGVTVWYDEFQLKVGDSLRRSIDKGLGNSRFGVVVLSNAFFAKNWPQYELDGMVAREMNGIKVILPIWHQVTKDEVLKFSPSIADRVALNSSLHSIQEIASKLAEVALDGKKN